jgi:hypothetical protein
VARLARIVHGMSSERPTEDPSQAVPPDSAHLDEDAEALEDPVHCGDAKHQHDLHEQAGHHDG